MDYHKPPKGGWSYRKIAVDVGLHFERAPVSGATIQNDIIAIREKYEESERQRDAGVLDPAHFRQWRAKFFTDPGTGLPYETPDHQYHWFRVMMSLALKEDIPKETLEYLDLPEDINGDIEGRRKMLTLILLAPPRHGKTELAIHAIIWLICYQPNIRILYCSGVLQTSRDNASLIKAELEFNEGLIEAYGPFRTDDSEWNQRQFTVATRTIRAKTSTVLSIGRGSNVLSKDADLIVVDDPQDLDAAESETTTARDFRWLTTQLMSRREPHTPVLGLGSHLPTLFGDLWTQVEQTLEDTKQVGQKVIIKKVKAHDYEKCDTLNDVDEDGKAAHTICVLWPSLRPYWFLEAQRSMIGDDVLFEAVYNQELLESALSYFPKEIVRGEYTYPDEAVTGKGLYSDLDLKSIEPGILDTTRSWRTIPRCCNGGGTVLFGLGVDPGASDSKKASESAFVMAGVCSSCHRIYLVDFEHLRQSPELNPHTIIRFVESYEEISRVRIEINAYQKALARDPLIVQAQGKFRYLLEEWNTDDRKNDPMIGIPVLSRWMKQGKFSLPYKTEEDRETSEYFIRQLIRWPKRPNDLVMALWLCELSLAQMFEDSSYNVPEYGDGYERLPAYLQEQQFEVDMNDLVEY